MIKNFGIKTENLLIEDWGSRVMLDAVDFKFHKFTGKTKIYVAPESDHIFEAKEGDLVFHKDQGYGIIIIGKRDGKKYIQFFNMDLPTQYEVAESSETIMRDNKQFFAPMRETT